VTAEQGLNVYLVGGAIRDELLGLTPRERDWVVVGATAEDMLERGFKPVGKGFPVFLHPRTGEEYALARKERKLGHGYTGFVCEFDPGVTLEEDLLRRDLTINAIAKDAHGNLIDPYGGQADLQNRLIRHVSPAFIEDPLRILRVARFSARLDAFGFVVDQGTLRMMQTLSAGTELDHLAAERVWQEIHSALESAAPQRFFLTLHECGALVKLMPELAHAVELEIAGNRVSAADTRSFTALRCAAEVSGDTLIRFGALIHPLEENAWRRLSARLKMPAKWKRFDDLVVDHLPELHQLGCQQQADIVDWIYRVDGYRQPERLAGLLEVAEILIRSASERAAENFANQLPLVRSIFSATHGLSSADLSEKNLRGPDIGRALYKLRCDVAETLSSV